MARNIEPGSVLSQEDYDYLRSRCRVDEALNQWGCTLAEGVGDDGAPTENPIVGGDLTALAAGAPPPSQNPGELQSVHPDQVPFIDGAGDLGIAGADEDDDEIPPYSEWKVADLQSEIDNRNADRDEADQIVPTGKLKADLITALEADDEDGTTDEDTESTV